MPANERSYQPITHENPYLLLSPKDRIETFKSNLVSIMETPQPTEKQKKAFVNNLIAVQHTMAETSSNLSPKDTKESRIFADFFGDQAKILIEKNIVLPVKNEVIKPENQNFPAYLLSLNGILAELAHLEQIGQKPDTKKAQLYTDVLNSFQRFLCSEYSNNNTQEMKAVVDLGMTIYVEILNKLTALGHKLLSDNEKGTDATTQKTKEQTPNIQIKIDLTGIENSINTLITSIKEKMPKVNMDLGKWILNGIKRFTEKKPEKKQTQVEKPSQRTVWIEPRPATNNPFSQKENQRVTPSDENTASQNAGQKILKPDENVAEQKPEPEEEPLGTIFNRETSRATFDIDGSLVTAFTIGQQKFAIFKLYPDNHRPFTKFKKLKMDQTAQYLIAHLDANNNTSPFRTKALRQDETLVLGHNHWQDRFPYKDDDSVSGDHVQVYIKNQMPIVRDLNSANGTYFLLSQADILKPVAKRVVSKPEAPVAPPAKAQEATQDITNALETEKPKQKAEIIGQNYNIDLSESIQSFTTKYGSEIAAGSDKGINYSSHNEDRVVVSPDDEFLAVIDGMGGHGSGDRAAQIIAEELQNNPNNVAAAITKAKERMQQEANNFTISPDAGAPFISAKILRENGSTKLEYSYAGDCSLVVIDKQGRVKHVSKTDSYLNSPIFLARNNNVKLSADEMLYHEDRNIVSKAIDKKNDKFTTVTIDIESGDRVILMSDGINDNLTPYELSRIVSGKSASEAIEAVDTVTTNRMGNKEGIINTTPDRAKSGFFSDGYRSEPKKDNRGIAIIDIK